MEALVCKTCGRLFQAMHYTSAKSQSCLPHGIKVIAVRSCKGRILCIEVFKRESCLGNSKPSLVSTGAQQFCLRIEGAGRISRKKRCLLYHLGESNWYTSCLQFLMQSFSFQARDFLGQIDYSFS